MPDQIGGEFVGDALIGGEPGGVTGGVVVVGIVASITVSAPVGSVLPVTGPVTAITLAAPAGLILPPVWIPTQPSEGAKLWNVSLSVSVSTAGPVALITVASPAGSISTSEGVSGQAGAITVAAPAGLAFADAAPVTGPVAVITVAVPAGAAGEANSVAGLAGSIQVAAFAGGLVTDNVLFGPVAVISLSSNGSFAGVSVSYPAPPPLVGLVPTQPSSNVSAPLVESARVRFRGPGGDGMAGA